MSDPEQQGYDLEEVLGAAAPPPRTSTVLVGGGFMVIVEEDYLLEYEGGLQPRPGQDSASSE